MGRENVVLDDQPVTDCPETTSIKICRAPIDHALRQLLRYEKLSEILQGIRNDADYSRIISCFPSFLYLQMSKGTSIHVAYLCRIWRR